MYNILAAVYWLSCCQLLLFVYMPASIIWTVYLMYECWIRVYSHRISRQNLRATKTLLLCHTFVKKNYCLMYSQNPRLVISHRLSIWAKMWKNVNFLIFQLVQGGIPICTLTVCEDPSTRWGFSTSLDLLPQKGRKSATAWWVPRCVAYEQPLRFIEIYEINEHQLENCEKLCKTYLMINNKIDLPSILWKTKNCMFCT